MDKQTYLKKFSRWARWRLSAREAGEVLADYEDMLGQRPAEDDGTLIQDLGDPCQAARLLCEPKGYSRWLAVFCVLALCLLLPEYLMLRAAFYHQWPEALIFLPLLAGIAVSLVWFRPRRGEGRGPLPKGLLPALAALLLGLLLAGGVLYGLAAGLWQFISAQSYGLAARWTLWLTGTAAAAAGLWGLVRARMADRRWRALYVLGLAVLAECVLVLAFLTSLTLDLSAPDWWVPYAVRWSAGGVLGLVGTGVSLC